MPCALVCRYLFERTGVLPFYAGAGEAFGARPETPADLFRNMPRVLRDRFETVFRIAGGGGDAARYAASSALFSASDLADPQTLHACAALSVSEAFELCARLAALQRQRPPPLPADAPHSVRVVALAQYAVFLCNFS